MKETKEVRLIQEELGELEEQVHKAITERIEKLMKETVDNREKIEILEAEGTAKEETIKKQDKKLKETMKEKHKLEFIIAELGLEGIEEQDITNFTEGIEKLRTENVELENKLKVS